MNLVPVNRGITEQNAQLARSRKRCVHRADCSEKLLINRQVPLVFDLGRIPPNATKRFIGHVLTPLESIQNFLETRIPKFNDDVIYRGRESRVANQ